MNSQGMNEEEKRTDIETNLSLNMFVEAGAGAGKTTLIVRRIVNMLKGDYDPSEIVAITFTKKAAEELRGRIQKEVEAACETDKSLTDKLYRLDEMNISTIHSFCLVLLKEQGEAAGLPQDLRLIEDDEEKKFKKRYLNDFLRTLSQKDWDDIEKDKDKSENRRQIREYIEEFFMSICDLPAEVKIVTPRSLLPAYEIQQSLERLIMGDPAKSVPDLVSVILSEAPNCFDPEKNKGEKAEQITTVDDLLEAADGKIASAKTKEIILNTGEGEEYDIEAIVKQLITKDKFFSKSSLPVRYSKDNIDKANERLHEYVWKAVKPAKELYDITGGKIKDADGNEILLPFFEAVKIGEIRERHFRTLLSYAKKARDYYNDNRPANIITNDNLLELTRDLLFSDNTAPLDFFRSKYRTFFVDEFQDTDSLQAAFIYRLASMPGNPDKLRHGALFVVGDPKQSIYRFRGAEPEIYFQIKEKMEKLDNAKTYELSKNFRSNDKIIEWVNNKFDESDKYFPIVNTVTNGSTYSYRYMDPVNTVAQKSSGTLISGVYRYDNPDNEMCKAGSDKSLIYTECSTETDVDNLIKVITELTSKDENEDARYQITRYKKNGDSYDPVPEGIELSDFLIISPDTTNMDMYVTALKEHGIPVVLDGKVSLGRDKALNVYARIYKYLVNPRSPFYRMGAIEAIRESVNWDSEEEVAKYSDEILDCLYDDCRHMTPYGKAQYLERQVSVIFDKDTDIAVVDAHTVSTHIRQMLENINVNINGTGEDIIEEMDRYIETKLEHEMSLEEAPDAVRFMNLHKAKGLEGNIVILLDRHGRKKDTLVRMRIGNEFYPGVKPKYGKSWSSVSNLKDYEDKYVKDEGSEFHRLEYVALTRAKQAAIFLDVISNGNSMQRLFAHGKIDRKTSKLDKSSYSYDIKKCAPIFDTSKVHMPERPELDVRNYKVGNDEYPSVHEEKAMEPVSYIKINPSGLEKGTSPSKKKAVDEAKASGRSREDEFSRTLERPIGNLLGDALHNAMELIINGLMQKQTDMDKLVNYCSCRAVMNLARSLEIDGEFAERDVYQKFIAACGRAYIGWLTDRSQGASVLDKVETAYTELPFSYGIKNDVRTEWHNGSADLILKNNDGSFTLIDYKSDNDYLVPEEVMDISFKEKYEPQLNEYRNVIIKLFGADPDKIKTGIISFSQKDKDGNPLDGENVRIRYTPV